MENRKRVKREKREKGLQSPPEYADYPKTVIEDAVVAAVVVAAKRGTAVNRIAAPGTAPQSFICLISSIPYDIYINIISKTLIASGNPLTFSPLKN